MWSKTQILKSYSLAWQLVVCVCLNLCFAFQFVAAQQPNVVSLESRAQVRFSAEQVMRALHDAYPDRIGLATDIEGDWTVMLDSTRFYFADGRLLPENILARKGEFDPQPFFAYPATLPDIVLAGSEAERRIEAMVQKRNANPPRRSSAFFDTLYRSQNRAQSLTQLKSVQFFGKKVQINQFIEKKLAAVEKEIAQIARSNGEVKSWVDRLKSVAGWNWRKIADTNSRSFHAYGVALDLDLRSAQGKQSYWLWTAKTNKKWWRVPYSQRIHPPDLVVKAFENQGFAWGGKWLFFDTLHFEYRPELLLLAGFRP